VAIKEVVKKMDEISQLRLRKAIQNGLPLTEQPYLTLANDLGLSETQVMQTISDWQDDGLIKRLGLVVKHHSLGYKANAMVVWDIPDHKVDEVGDLLSLCDAVTLCYQRPRQLPEWNYNLFSMIHGQDRDTVLRQLADIVKDNGLSDFNRDVLFSYKLFKQCGGQYVQPTSTVGGVAL
jgi:DNA-binding Lrp family transcriptional regulator